MSKRAPTRKRERKRDDQAERSYAASLYVEQALTEILADFEIAHRIGLALMMKQGGLIDAARFLDDGSMNLAAFFSRIAVALRGKLVETKSIGELAALPVADLEDLLRVAGHSCEEWRERLARNIGSRVQQRLNARMAKLSFERARATGSGKRKALDGAAKLIGKSDESALRKWGDPATWDQLDPRLKKSPQRRGGLQRNYPKKGEG